MGSNLRRQAASIAVAGSAAVVVVAGAVLLFLNPVWVGFEQARTNADRLTGYTLEDVHRVTNAILGELILGPATFLQQVAGVDVFDPKERQHLADVRGVLVAFYGVALIALAVLVVAGIRSGDRARFWRSVGRGTAVLAGAVVIVGSAFALFFEAAFDFFHRLFFASGSYTFNPGHERLVQLFPEDFWSETSIVLAIVILVLAAAVAWFALRRAATSVALASTAGRPLIRGEGTA